MAYDFDEVIDRKGTSCLKYDFAVERGYPEGVLPFWVADMDFRTAPCVVEELQRRVAHGIFGYTDPSPAYKAVVCRWMRGRDSQTGLQRREDTTLWRCDIQSYRISGTAAGHYVPGHTDRVQLRDVHGRHRSTARHTRNRTGLLHRPQPLQKGKEQTSECKNTIA